MAENKRLADAKLVEAYEEYSSFIARYCALRLKADKDAVDDCVQNTFLVFYRRLLSGEQFKNPKAFLYFTASNMCKKADDEKLRNAKRTAELIFAEDIPASEDNSEALMLDYDIIRDILIAQLSEKEQDLYQLKYVERRSLAEIAQIYGISPSATATRTSRLRAKIHELVEPVLEDYIKGGHK